MVEEKGLFQRIKEVFTGEEEREGEQQQSTESIKINARDEEELNKITEENKEQKTGLQKVDKEVLEANPNYKASIEALKEVVDPELQIDIWTLGLVYNIEQKEKELHVLLTFTSIMCPVGPMIVKNVETVLKKLSGIEKVLVEVTFTPPWEPTEELREMLGV